MKQHDEFFNKDIEKSRKMEKIFLIEKAWIDPMENYNADGYKPFGFVLTEKEAVDFCDKGGVYTGEDCWSIKYKPNGKMSKYRFIELKNIE